MSDGLKVFATSIPNEVPVVFHNGSNYDFPFIIKFLAKTFERKDEYDNKKCRACKTKF